MKVAEIEQTSQDRIDDKIFANERADASWDKAHLRVSNSTSAKMGFRDSKFRQCDLSFCVFIDCYFKKTFFDQTKLVGCIFINCNFDMASFVSCDFRYATFNNCFIPYEQIKMNLPHGEENLCSDICKNLSAQCLKLGEIENYKAFLFEERAAGEVHSIRKLFHSNNSYYSKYSLWDGINGLFDFLRSKVSKYLWGYGEKMGALLRSIIITILIYGAFFTYQINNISSPTFSYPKWASAIYLSACNFFSVSTDFVLKTESLRIVGLSEHIIGAVLMGFFVAALFRQINRR